MLNNSGSFTELNLWKTIRKFRNEVFLLCKQFPNEEQYKLKDQLLRSTRSISANIAEGHGRFHFQENIQFCRIARGSLSECYDHLICGLDCRYITENKFVELEKEIMKIKKLLNGYIKFLKSKKNEL